MKQTNEVLARDEPSEAKRPPKERWPDVPPKLIIAGLVLVGCFSPFLVQWARFALNSELFSYTLLVPIISVYLFVVNKKRAFPAPSPRTRVAGAVLIGAGVVMMGLFLLAKFSGSALGPQDSVAFSTFSFVLLLAGIVALGLNPAEVRRAVFPLGFLVFMVPFPIAMEHAIESFLQQGSAPPAYWLLRLAGTPVFRQDLIFQLPGMSLHIAPECSGIRSTVVLFMTSILAGYLFLRSPWKRTLLAAFVVPLALVRNGFRIFTIGELCVNIGPHMIDSMIHHRGGPIFFALSLIPFFVFLFFLIRSERSAPKPLLHDATR